MSSSSGEQSEDKDEEMQMDGEESKGEDETDKNLTFDQGLNSEEQANIVDTSLNIQSYSLAETDLEALIVISHKENPLHYSEPAKPVVNLMVVPDMDLPDKPSSPQTIKNMNASQ